VPDEQHQGERSGDDRAEHRRRRPAVLVAVHDAPDHGEHAEPGEQQADQVEALRPSAGLGQRAQHQRHGDQRHRHVDPEHRLPGDPVHDGTADHRPERDAEAGDPAPEPDRHGAPGDRDRGGEQGERQRHDRGGADALDGAGGDQRGGAVGEGGPDRREREQRDPAEEGPAAPPAVAEGGGRDHQRGEGERVRVDHPLQVGQGGGELRAQHGQRGGDDQVVQGRHEHGQRGGEQGDPDGDRAALGEGVRHRWLQREKLASTDNKPRR
jgi:hypothetical protein